MTTMPRINWQPIANIPEDRKDGRYILFWDKENGEFLGGPMVGQWLSGHWVERQENFKIRTATHWADINPPV